MPDDWRRTQYSEVSSFINGDRGYNYPSGSDFVERGIPFINAGHLTAGSIDFASMNYITRSKYEALGGGKVQDEDILYCIRGSLGKAARVDSQAVPGAIASSLVIIRPTGSVDSRFLFLVLTGPPGKRLIRRLDNGSAQPNISANNLQLEAVDLPPLPEQRRIAEILDTLDDAIRKTKEIIAKLEQVKQGLLHDLLTRGIDDNGELRDPVRHPEQFKDSPLGRIPKDWDSMQLRNVSDLDVGYAFKSEWFSDSDGIRLLRGENVGYGSPDWSLTKRLPERYAESFSEYRLHAGDVVIGMDRTFTKTGVKVTLIGKSDIPALLVQRVGRFVPSAATSRRFVLHLLRWPTFHRELLAQQKGMDIPHLSKAEILTPFVPVPPEEEQSYIAERLDRIDLRSEEERRTLEKLRSLKQGLMEDLLTGRVRVTPLLDETAE